MEKYGALIATVMGAIAGAAVAVVIVIIVKWVSGTL